MKYFITLFITICCAISSVYSQNTVDKNSTSSENVSILKKEFILPKINKISHKIGVYLPPNYHTSSKKFPVVYMHDAQNLFDNATSFLGELEVDESLNKLFKATGKGFIVVGIENGGAEVGFQTQFNVKYDNCNFLYLWTLTEVELENSTKLHVTHIVTESFPNNIPEFKPESCREGCTYFIKQNLKSYFKKTIKLS